MKREIVVFQDNLPVHTPSHSYNIITEMQKGALVMQDEIRHEEYVKLLLEKRKQEIIKSDPVNEINLMSGEGLTSPISSVSLEETRILQEYMEQKNLFHTTSVDTNKRKVLTLRRFFQKKRNQQVIIYANIAGEITLYKGKVNAIGRDFVTITNLKDRIWIPYDHIDAANIPYGIPNYSNTHQHYLYDNDLRKKLLLNFGEVVSQKDALIQQFHFESLRTNLARWENTWVKVKLSNHETCYGKINNSSENTLRIKHFRKAHEIPLEQIEAIETIRLFQIFTRLVKIGLKF
ncbi:hypothetical protein ACDX78_01660 [Virgibacillus oceani]